MLNAQEILEFHFSSAVFKQSAQRIIPPALIIANEKRIEKLKRILDEVGATSFIFLGSNLIPQVFKKFKNSLINENIIFERRELRTLVYAFNYSEHKNHSIFSNTNEFNTAITLLETNWRDFYLVGLIDCFLKNWETDNQYSLDKLEMFISSKLNSYKGNRNTLNSFKDNKRFFNSKNGDLILGDTIAKLKKPIQEATKILGVPASWLSYPYFSKVILTYYEKTKNRISEEFDGLSVVLQKHNSSVTSKRVISKIIIQTNKPEFLTIQDQVKKLAFSQIGDPSNTSNWSIFEKGTEIEISEIIKARNILNEWITRQFINVFFNVCINDDRRKKFWLKYVSNISAFKVYGPTSTKNILKRDERIAEYIDARFETVYSSKDVSAFILYIRNYMIIEFSNDGYACCAYKIESSNRPALNQKLNSVDDLRNSSLPLAIQSVSDDYYTSDEGRLFHNSNWESKFNYWLKEKVIK
jgi:hypothetical protein